MRSALLSLLLCAPLGAESLADATLARALDAQLGSQGVSYLLVRVEDRSVIRESPGFDEAIPLGSLVKPFTALAYGERHGYRYPRFTCRGEQDGCWLPRGHGEIGIEDAIAHSCNAWFGELARRTDASDVVEVLARYGVHAPTAAVAAGTLIGRGGEWRLSPLEVTRAYCELATRASDWSVKTILNGMSLAAQRGTAAAAQTPAYAKTGTAPCSHSPAAAGDGFALLLFPRDRPQYALLVRQHNSTGARTAAAAGRALRTMREGK